MTRASRSYSKSRWMALTTLLMITFLSLGSALQVHAQLRKATQLIISPETFTIEPGQSITITAKLTSDGQPLAGKQIVFAATLGSVSPNVATTDENGEASAVYTAPRVNVSMTITITASFLGDLRYKESTVTCQGIIEVKLPKISISGASFAVPESLKEEISSYRMSIPEDIKKLLPIELPNESFILATPESLYLVFADKADSGLAYVEGWKLSTDINLKGMSLGVVIAKSVTFEKEGTPVMISDILANPDDYKFKLVKVSANRRQVSILYDPDDESQTEFPITIGYLTEREEKPLDVVKEILERAKEFTLELDEQLIKDFLQSGEEERIWLFNFNYEYWYDAPAITNGIVLPTDHSIFELIEESMPTIGKFASIEGRVVLYDVNTDIPYEAVSSVRELKANYDEYLGKVVKLEANCYGGYLSVQEMIEENTPCGRNYVYIEGSGCVNIVVDVRLEGSMAWNQVHVPPEPEELLLVAGVSSYHQDEQFVEFDGVFELIGKVVSTRQISDSLPEGIALMLCRAERRGEIDFDELEQQVKDEIRSRVGELYWVLQNIYPYEQQPEIPISIPKKVFNPLAPIFVREPNEIPEIFVGKNFTIRIGVAQPGAPIKLEIVNSHITNISIALKDVVENVTIYFKKLSGRPTEVSKPPGPVYAYHEISVNVAEEALKGANITFWVLKEWLTANRAAVDDVVMLRYHDVEWKELPTRCIGENATHFKFMAETPGFSVFAIAVREAAPSAITTGVEGYIRDEAGNPISGAHVIVLSKVVTIGKVSEVETDEMGHYSLEIPPGDYIIVFSARGYADMSAEVSLSLGEVDRVDATLKKAKAEFSEDWVDVKFELAVVTEEPWKVGAEATLQVWITVYDMGGNREVEFRQLELGLPITSVEKTTPLNIKTEIGGTVYSGNVTLKLLEGFELMEPDSEESYSLQINLDGSVTDSLGLTWPGLTMESTTIRVYAPPSPVSLSLEAPEKITIGDEFEVRVKLRNDGECSIQDVEVKLLVPFGTSAVGSTDWSKDALNPGEEAAATFKLKADSAGSVNIKIGLSYRTLWGYLVFEPSKTLGSILISKIPTSISISVTPEKVTVGENVVVKGSIQPAMSVPLMLTITEPDGTTRTLYETSAPQGTFGFEVTLTKEGRYSFVVSYEGDLTYEASISNEVYAEAEKKKACIIATAAYGSELDPHVQFLRSFRDDFALKTFAGSNFMEIFNAWYYSFSPSIASFISTSDTLRATTRVMIYPLIGILRFGVIVSDIFSFNSEMSVIVAGIIISALIGLVYFTPPTLLALYLAERRRKIPKLGVKALLTSWVISMLLVILAELTLSSALMKIGSGALVLCTIALVTWTVAIEVSTKLLAYYGSKT